MGEKFAQMTQLKIILNKALFFIKPEIMDKLYLIMDYNGKGAINEKEFMVIMRPWASFSATDINNDNELDIHELKTLIWLMDNEEPDDRRVQKDLKLIDDDCSGTIDRLEWI
jgi:Ca2+-binding EF-hand superfamily protein